MGSDGGLTGGLGGVGVGLLFCDNVVSCCFSLLLLVCEDGVVTVGVGGSSTIGCSSFCRILEDVELLSFARCDSLSFLCFLVNNRRVGIRRVAGK